MKNCIAMVLLGCGTMMAHAQGTGFTYQGRLTDGPLAANGLYDLSFALFAAGSGGVPVSGPVTTNGVAVNDGLFTVTLDFGQSFPGADRFLEIAARTNGGGAFTTLTPRQPITATPYAVRAQTAGGVPPGSITSAMLAPGSAAANLLASDISGVPQGGVVLSAQEFASNLLNQGYVRLGKVDAVPEAWRTLTNGPSLGAVQVSPRRDFAAVWTGTELIVWGGSDGSGPLNSGGRYHPATDTWTPISTLNAPSPQTIPAAAWTGTQLIVWGNTGPARGGRYNPSTDTWLPLNEVNAPAPRTTHSALWTGTHLIIWGGIGGSGYVNSGARYDPATDTWSPVQTSGAPAIRGRHSAVWTGTEMIIWGGFESHSCGTFCVAGTNYNDGARYNPVSNTWQPLTTVGAPFNRSLHSAVWTGTEMIVWGGLVGSGGTFFSGGTNANSGGRYNPSLNQWTSATSTAGAPAFRSGHHAHWTGSRMLVWGGANSTLSTNFTDGAQYNPANNTWAALNNTGAPSSRVGPGTVWTGSQLIVWGGESATQLGVYPAIGNRYTTATDSWSATSASGEPSARADHTAVWAETEMLGWGGTGSDSALRTGGRLKPTLAPSNMWSAIAVANAPSARTDHTTVWTGSDMLVWGGFNGAQALNTGGRYTPGLDGWSALSTTGAPTPRVRHVAVWTGSQLIVWGGFDGTNFLANGGRYNPAANTWQGISTVNAPNARADATAVWTGSEMIVWGGQSVSGGVTNHLDTGARYDPVNNTWQPLPTAAAPAPRYDHTAVWSGGEMIVWGGETPSGKTNSGARYLSAANQWIPLPAIGAPSARSQHTAVWAGTLMIVWGGFDGANEVATGAFYQPDRDLWTTMTSTNAPQARQRHTAVWSGTEMIVWAGRRFDGLNNVFQDSAHAYTPPRTLFLYLRP